MKGKRWLRLSAGAAAGYVLLLALLTALEKGAEGASIQSFTDALWYSIVTLSTVGYGDLYPVTWGGKLIGLLFVLLSVGVLAFVLGAAVSALTGNMLPRLRLWLLRDKQWYVFSEMNDASLNLARSLGDDGAVMLFPMESKTGTPAGKNICYYPDTMAEAVAGKKDRCAIFFLNEQSGTNYEQAVSLGKLGCPVYCRTEQNPDRCSENLKLFNRYACCARDYWHRLPLRSGEEELVFIGDGRYARELLEQGLQVNVFQEGRAVRYHLFGDWAHFRRNHPYLTQTLCINESREGEDSLHLSDDPWNTDSALLLRAHRIILCSDDDQENLAVLRQLRRYFPVGGSIHLRMKQAVAEETVFGTDEQIYTAENVMAGRLTQTARDMHRIYMESVSRPVPGWEDLSEFARQSNLAAADHLSVKLRLLLDDETITELTAENCEEAYHRFLALPQREWCRRMEHRRWMRFHSLHNWRYGSVRDDRARLHPMMCPFDALTEAEQAKDDYAWQLLEPMAKKLERDMEE